MMQWIVSSSVLILVVIALRYVLRGKLSLRMQYALWLLVLVRLLVPVSFGASDLSVMNAVPERAPTVQQGTYKQDIVGERNDAPTNAGTVGIPAQSMNEAALPNLVQNVTTATVTAPTVEKDRLGADRKNRLARRRGAGTGVPRREPALRQEAAPLA